MRTGVAKLLRAIPSLQSRVITGRKNYIENNMTETVQVITTNGDNNR